MVRTGLRSLFLPKPAPCINPSCPVPEAVILRQITERSLAVFFLYNLQTRKFGYASPSFEEVWAREEERINEDIPWLLASVHPGDLPMLEAGYQRLLTHNLRDFREFRIRGENGREKWIYLTAYAIEQNGGRLAIAGFGQRKKPGRKAGLFWKWHPFTNGSSTVCCNPFGNARCHRS